MPTPWESFRARWGKGCSSSLCPKANRICLARGKVPCDVLFVGEAPSVGADVVGQPFVGKTGLVLDDIIKRSMPDDVRWAFTNLVGCIPRNSEGGGKAVKEPPAEAILACQPRLQDFVELCKPKLS